MMKIKEILKTSKIIIPYENRCPSSNPGHGIKKKKRKKVLQMNFTRLESVLIDVST